MIPFCMRLGGLPVLTSKDDSENRRDDGGCRARRRRRRRRAKASDAPASQGRRPPPAEPSHTGRLPPRNRGPSQRLLTRITGQETAACQGLARRRAPAACARAAERSGPGKGGRLPGGGQPAPGHSGPDLGVCAPDPQRPGQAMVCIQARLWSVATPAYDLQAGLAKAGYGRRRLIRRFRCGNRSVRSQGAGRPQQRRRGGGGKQRLCGPSQPRQPGQAGPGRAGPITVRRRSGGGWDAKSAG